MVGLFNAFIYEPIYNALAFVVLVIPGGDVGIAIILITVVIKLALFPLSLVAIRTQVLMREIDPQLKKIKKEFENNKEEVAKRTMALLKEKNVNPFASIFLILIQIPIILGLYFVFRLEGAGGGFDTEVLYSFISLPTNASFIFLGLIDLTSRNWVLAALVAITQFYNARLMIPMTPQGEEGSIQHDLAKSMNVQMRYVFPVIMGVVAYVISAAIALYFLISNLFQLFQELYVKRTRLREEQHG